jgi:putative nucleotidyltransferase with HDIG domain
VPIPLKELLAVKVKTIPFPVAPFLKQAAQMLDGPRPDLEAVEELLSIDKQYLQRVINASVANSNHTAEDFEAALKLLGQKPMRDVVAELAEEAQANAVSLEPKVLEILKGPYWNHSQLTAICSHLLAQETGYPSLPQAYTAGLLHDVGRCILTEYDYNELAKALELPLLKTQVIENAEDQVHGYNHSYVGGAVLEEWKAAPAIIGPIKKHHAPRDADANQRLAKILHLADVAVSCQQAKLPIGITLFPVDRTLLKEPPFNKMPLLEIAAQAAKIQASLEEMAPLSI